MNSILVLLFTAVISFGCVYLSRLLALELKIFDKPGPRKLHQQSKPLLGGLGLFAALGVSVFLFAGMGWVTMAPALMSSSVLTRSGVWAASLLLVAIGLLDDLWGAKFPYQMKLAAQIAAAFIVVYSGIRLTYFANEGLNGVISVVWIVSLTNAFNLLDNMDGLAAGVAAIAGLFMSQIFFASGQGSEAFSMLAFVGVCGGFLILNFRPAKIFMGDAGSHFLGFFLSVACLHFAESAGGVREASLGPALIPLLLLSVPIYDTTSVILIRWSEGRPAFTGDRSHLSHRLMDAGLDEPLPVLAIYGLACLGGALAIVSAGLSDALVIVLLGGCALGYFLLHQAIRTAIKRHWRRALSGEVAKHT